MDLTHRKFNFKSSVLPDRVVVKTDHEDFWKRRHQKMDFLEGGWGDVEGKWEARAAFGRVLGSPHSVERRARPLAPGLSEASELALLAPHNPHPSSPLQHKQMPQGGGGKGQVSSVPSSQREVTSSMKQVGAECSETEGTCECS